MDANADTTRRQILGFLAGASAGALGMAEISDRVEKHLDKPAEKYQRCLSEINVLKHQTREITLGINELETEGQETNKDLPALNAFNEKFSELVEAHDAVWEEAAEIINDPKSVLYPVRLSVSERVRHLNSLAENMDILKAEANQEIRQKQEVFKRNPEANQKIVQYYDLMQAEIQLADKIKEAAELFIDYVDSVKI